MNWKCIVQAEINILKTTYFSSWWNVVQLTIKKDCLFFVQLLCFKNNNEKISRSFSGQTALHLASFYGHEDVVIELINYGASVNAADSSGYNPLHVSQLFDAFNLFNPCSLNSIASRASPFEFSQRKVTIFKYQSAFEPRKSVQFFVFSSDHQGLIKTILERSFHTLFLPHVKDIGHCRATRHCYVL